MRIEHENFIKQGKERLTKMRLSKEQEKEKHQMEMERVALERELQFEMELLRGATSPEPTVNAIQTESKENKEKSKDKEKSSKDTSVVNATTVEELLHTDLAPTEEQALEIGHRYWSTMTDHERLCLLNLTEFDAKKLVKKEKKETKKIRAEQYGQDVSEESVHRVYGKHCSYRHSDFYDLITLLMSSIESRLSNKPKQVFF